MKKERITIITMIIITLVIVIFSGVSIFNSNDKYNFKLSLFTIKKVRYLII